MEASTEASREKMKTIESFSLGNLVRELKYKILSQFQHIQYLIVYTLWRPILRENIIIVMNQVGHTLWCLICSTWVVTNGEALRL